jgi:hypothetical protein
MNRSVIDYFRCPEQILAMAESGPRVSVKVVRHGKYSGADSLTRSTEWKGDPKDLLAYGSDSTKVESVADLSRIIDDLRHERYVDTGTSRLSWLENPLFRRAYYAIRPLLIPALRRYIQSIYYAGFQRIPFPHWPVDFTVDQLVENSLAESIKQVGGNGIPFIWFWPSGHSGCVIVTHDVETKTGLDFCTDLMDLDDAAGIKSSFQIVPRERYPVPQKLLQEIRDRGFELNVHDLNHDGQLFASREVFRRRAREINACAREFGAAGFRSGGLYRQQEWYSDFDFSYDMSVPNCGHLEVQRGGCCTVMPYFIGGIVELPLTTAQDYPLFCLLGDFDLTLWKTQVELILSKRGLISFLIHPDYVREARAQAGYKALLKYITALVPQRDLWLARPGEVDKWWRARSRMRLIPEGDSWRIDGAGSERAQIAYAKLEGDRLTYKLGGRCLAR